jgi:plastocyanin
MNFRDPRRHRAPEAGLAAVAVLLCVAPAASAGSLTAEVTDRDGQPVDDVVLYAIPLSDSPGPPVVDVMPSIDQEDRQFTPHILVVQTGTAVLFPNHDTVSHHVYSFSRPKPFELPLYKGVAYPPVVFDHAGVVDLGCNIHDSMEAHIVVVDTPYFALTGNDGRAVLAAMPDGDYTVQLYTPRLRDSQLPAATHIRIPRDGVLQLRFDSRLGPSHKTSDGSLEWSHY